LDPKHTFSFLQKKKTCAKRKNGEGKRGEEGLNQHFFFFLSKQRKKKALAEKQRGFCSESGKPKSKDLYLRMTK